jgi:hypothetical protein
VQGIIVIIYLSLSIYIYIYIMNLLYHTLKYQALNHMTPISTTSNTFIQASGVMDYYLVGYIVF